MLIIKGEYSVIGGLDHLKMGDHCICGGQLFALKRKVRGHRGKAGKEFWVCNVLHGDGPLEHLELIKSHRGECEECKERFAK